MIDMNKITYTNNCGDNCEPSFSWSSCDKCRSTLGGDRHDAVEWESNIGYPVEICCDCLVEIS